MVIGNNYQLVGWLLPVRDIGIYEKIVSGDQFGRTYMVGFFSTIGEKTTEL